MNVLKTLMYHGSVFPGNPKWSTLTLMSDRLIDRLVSIVCMSHISVVDNMYIPVLYIPVLVSNDVSLNRLYLYCTCVVLNYTDGSI